MQPAECAEKELGDSASTAFGTAERPTIIWNPGGIFRMDSDRHYPEEALVRHVAVDGFWIDRTLVTNDAFCVEKMNTRPEAIRGEAAE